MALNELLNHFKMQHSNIVGFKRALCTATHLCIVMERCNCSLLSLIPPNVGLPEANVRYFVAQVLNGLSRSHELEIVNRDIKVRPAACGIIARGSIPHVTYASFEAGEYAGELPCGCTARQAMRLQFQQRQGADNERLVVGHHRRHALLQTAGSAFSRPSGENFSGPDKGSAIPWKAS